MTTNSDKEELLKLCNKALEDIRQAIKKHRKGEEADLSIEILERVASEVDLMKQSLLDAKHYMPGYSRYILDSWEDKHGLINFLVDLVYKYKQYMR